MANISRAERERREQEAAAAAQAQENQNPEPQQETAPAEEVPAKTPEKSIYAVDELDVKHFKAHKLAEEKQKSLDAIEQAVKDACQATEDKIRKDPVVVALAEDPGDVEKRLEFLRKFGPRNVKPPRPAPTPFGIKDPKLMEWMATYDPQEFVKLHGNGTSPIAKALLAKIRKSA